MKKIFLTYLIAIMSMVTAFPAAASGKLTFVTDPFPPYYYEEDGKTKGIQYELAVLAFQKLRIQFEVKFLPWKRALMTAQARNASGIFGLRKTREREEWLIYPEEPLMTVRTVIFHRAEDKFNYTGIESLKGKKVGITKGYTYGSEFDRSRLFQKEEVSSLQLNFLKLKAGRIDLVASYRAVGLLALEQMGLDESISFSPNPIQSVPIYLGFTKTPGNGALALKFDKALKDIKKSPECLELINRLQIDVEMISPCE
ncbi:substrate-binding periplasmic protein [Maridesulfovibrio sp. FT414]|uniref:substrate-binding periplasmic protein n=1 Tax=Maridesulfovibrio sp. FT414 TaxID=2979469 RepID=UPI003D80565D